MKKILLALIFIMSFSSCYITAPFEGPHHSRIYLYRHPYYMYRYPVRPLFSPRFNRPEIHMPNRKEEKPESRRRELQRPHRD